MVRPRSMKNTGSVTGFGQERTSPCCLAAAGVKTPDTWPCHVSASPSWAKSRHRLGRGKCQNLLHNMGRQDACQMGSSDMALNGWEKTCYGTRFAGCWGRVSLLQWGRHMVPHCKGFRTGHEVPLSRAARLLSAFGG